MRKNRCALGANPREWRRGLGRSRDAFGAGQRGRGAQPPGSSRDGRLLTFPGPPVGGRRQSVMAGVPWRGHVGPGAATTREGLGGSHAGSGRKSAWPVGPAVPGAPQGVPGGQRRGSGSRARELRGQGSRQIGPEESGDPAQCVTQGKAGSKPENKYKAGLELAGLACDDYFDAFWKYHIPPEITFTPISGSPGRAGSVLSLLGGPGQG